MRARLCDLILPCLVLIASPAMAETTPPAVPTLQADFDAASAAVDQGHCTEAEPIFARLAADPRVKPGSLPAAMITLRRGLCRIATGDVAQGEAWVRAGLPVVEAAGPTMAPDAALGWLALARLEMSRYDHDDAAAAYRHVLALPGQGDRVDALTGLAMVTGFDGDGAALALTDRAQAIVDAVPNGHARTRSEAGVRTVRARILMNMGRYDDAAKEAEKALTLSGGLTTRVTLNDVSLRSDAAQAALLAGRRDRARELLAFTGAGRIAESPFASARVMRVPDCDEEIGLRPDDSAVVEFTIRDDGSVGNAQTVFTRGNYAIARAFARAVRGWVWQPESVARLPPFYRALIRVELHCTRSGGGLPGVATPFFKRIRQWAAPLTDNARQPGMTDLGAADALRQRAGALESAGDRIGAGTVLLAALTVDPVIRPGQQTDIDHAIALLADADMPRRASAAAMRAMILDHLAGLRGQSDGREVSLLDAADTPAIAGDALAQGTVRLEALRDHWRHRYSPREIAVLHQIADDARLDGASPLRQVALLRLAGLAASDGHLDEAQALFGRTGLAEEQCALVGDIPRLRYGGSDNDYPVDALRMGFEGWVREEFDIAANGHPVAPRTIIAYPPFVFVDGATAMARDFRYDASFRPSGKLACSARAETINFHIPSNH